VLVVGGLLETSIIATRPKIALSVGVLSRFMSYPVEDHVEAYQKKKLVLRYMLHTRSYGNRYCRSTPLEEAETQHQHVYLKVDYHP